MFGPDSVQGPYLNCLPPVVGRGSWFGRTYGPCNLLPCVMQLCPSRLNPITLHF